MGVLATEWLGVIRGVMGGSILGFAMVEAPRARVWELSRRRFGASLIFGWVWHWDWLGLELLILPLRKFIIER